MSLTSLLSLLSLVSLSSGPASYRSLRVVLAFQMQPLNLSPTS